MAYGTLKADVIQSDTAGTPPQFNDGNGTQTGTLCRAWVNFAGATGTISTSFNVSSVTRSGTGTYTVNFTNAFPDANYVASTQASLTNYYVFPGTNSASSATTTTFNPGGFYINGSGSTYSFALGDPTTVRIAIFR